MKIVADSDIPYLCGVFEPYSKVEYIKGGAICRAAVRDADALIVRTRTRCDAALLSGSRVRVISTATIGTDHIDIDWCERAGIAVRSAAGCNARAVAQWVFSALRMLGVTGGTIGIVGVGNVGSEVLQMGQQLGFCTLLCDPPRQARGESGFIPLGELLSLSDVVTLHVPLLDTTRAMVDDKFLGAMRPTALLMNSSRGEVVDPSALLRSTISYGLDVWPNEPFIDRRLLCRSVLSTPHIAGYSSRGKARGTQMAVRQTATLLGINALTQWSPVGDFPLEDPDTFDIAALDAALRQNPLDFEALRTIRP